MENSILIAGAGANQIGIFEKAREMGIVTVAVDGDSKAVGFEYADHVESANILDSDVLAEIATRYAVSGIYPAAELSVEAVAIAASTLGLPGVPPEVATRVRNKVALRDALERAGLPNPRYREVKTCADAIEAIDSIGYPCIIKPSDANSSKGVQQLNAASEVQDAFELAVNYSFSDSALIEEYMPGDEYCVDGLVYQGNYIPGGITGKEVSPLPYRYDKGIFMPPQESTQLCDTLERCARDALSAVGFANGTFHLEVIVSPEGPRIVEIAGRPGGGRIPTDLIPIVYGMDFMGDSIRIAIGQGPTSTRKHERGVALYWFDANSGVVTEITGLEEAQALPGVREVVIQVQLGDTVQPIIDCVTRDAIGYVLAEGDTPAEAIDAANRARTVCKIVTA